MAASGILDPTKQGKYPVILSDALLGKPSKETYTGIRYNHRPTLSSDTAPDTARLKKSAKDDSYNLGFDDQGDKYQYNGVRTTNDGNYVLIFDPARKAFVLHRVDSTFHMNVTRTPSETNAENLRTQFPQLEVKSAPAPKKPRGKAANKATPTKSKGGRQPAEDTPKSKASSQTDKNKAVGLGLTLPDLSAPAKKPEPAASQSAPDKSKRRALSPVESEEDDDDDDGGLTVEYPDANPAKFRSTSSYMPPVPVMTRRFSEFANERELEEDDFEMGGTSSGYGMAPQDEEEGYEEEEYEEEDDEEPPRSPPRQPQIESQPVPEESIRFDFDDGDEEWGAETDALEADIGELEAELEREFDKAQNGGHESDSSVSEEE